MLVQDKPGYTMLDRLGPDGTFYAKLG